MAIGDLYNAANVVTGQAAAFVAPVNTPLINLANWDLTDPFNVTPWYNYTVNVGSITSFTLTFVRRGVSATTTSQTVTGLTAAALQTAIAALANVGSGNVKVTGTTTTGPFFISFNEGLTDGVLTMTPTGGAGSSLVGPVWTPVGATEQGWQFGADKSTNTIQIEEQSTPVGMTVSSQNVSIQGNLSEDISKTLLLALNATKVVVAPTTQIGGYDLITPTDTVLQYAVALVTQNAEGFGRIIYAPAWTSLAGVSAAFKRASGQRLYGVTFQTVCATNQIQILNFTQNHS